MELPKVLMTRSSHQCRREGLTYSLQCLPCALGGVRAVYWGESGLSARQRLQQHRRDCNQGLVSAPMVQHSIEAHGGTRPDYLGLIHLIEPKPLYHAVRESVLIGMMPSGLPNINRCNEWGAPRVPVLVATGGDDEDDGKPLVNPRPSWSKDLMIQIKRGNVKRIKYWDEETRADPDGQPSQQQPRDHQGTPKRPRKDPLSRGGNLEAMGPAKRWLEMLTGGEGARPESIGAAAEVQARDPPPEPPPPSNWRPSTGALNDQRGRGGRG